jgi:aminoglycoside 3-N-acetyltransferase I
MPEGQLRRGGQMRVVRLTTADRHRARVLFALMANVFGEEAEELADDYIDSLLARGDFWAIAAISEEEVVGGLTAHTLPMTRAASSEIFIYDLAVRKDLQRRGIGRDLVRALCDEAAALGILTVFVPVDRDDVHALDFYRALHGVPMAMTMFTFTGGAGRRT